MATRRLSHLLPAAVLAAVVLLATGVSLRGDFVWDDRPLIIQDHRVQDGDELGSFLSSGFWESGGRHDRFRSFYRPVIGLSFALDRAIWGARPFGFHLTNVLVHLLCCWLVFRIAVGEGMRRGPALAGAAVFAAHPVHVESVAWISGRTDLLCTAFFLLAYLIVRVLVLGAASEPLYTLDGTSWIATAAFVLARYSMLLIFPVGLDAHYPYPALESPVDPVVGLSILMLAVIAASALRMTRDRPCTGFWTVWAFIGLVPVMAFGRFGDVLLADRFLYLPSVGLAVLVAAGLQWAVPVTPEARRLAVGASIVVVLVLSGLSSNRCRVWRDDLALFSDMARTSPDSGLVQCNLGMALYRRDKVEEAIARFQRAIELVPDYAMAHNNLAAALERSGRPRQALTHYLLALRLAPLQTEARLNAGHLLVALDLREPGLRMIRDVVRERPRSPHALFVLADALYRVGESAEAERLAESVCVIDPSFAQAPYLLGRIRFEQGRIDQAAHAMDRFLGLWSKDDVHAAAARRIVRRAALAQAP